LHAAKILLEYKSKGETLVKHKSTDDGWLLILSLSALILVAIFAVATSGNP
jgi:uncharacterized integral membrane protein